MVLTWNEARNVGGLLDGLASQTEQDLEVLVVDAASTDGTPRIVLERIAGHPLPVVLDAAPVRLSVGAARNRGVALARAPHVAFLSADTVPEPGWAAAALAALGRAPAVFGAQVHAPRARGVGACVRGLRYHFPDEPRAEGAALASNVNAAFAKALLRAHPFGTSATESALDDLLLARRLRAAGHRVAYEPAMRVAHSDVDSARMELRKNWREGLGWGAHRDELGLHRLALAWAALLGMAAGALLLQPGWATVLALALALWLPALRRAVRRRRDVPPGALLLGVLSTPPFDLAFLAAYLAGLAQAPRARPRPSQEARA